MQDHGAVPHGAIQYNHDAVPHGAMQKGSDCKKNLDPIYFMLKFLKGLIIAIFTQESTGQTQCRTGTSGPSRTWQRNLRGWDEHGMNMMIVFFVKGGWGKW
jgi:hypothetical protein